jgi:hypothetical protein
MEKEKLMELFSVIKKRHVDIGEAAMIICRHFRVRYELPKEWVSGLNENFPTVWERIPDSALEEQKEWWINNWFRVFALLQPVRHDQIMQMTSPDALQYQEWYNSHGEKGHKMMKDFKAPPWWN